MASCAHCGTEARAGQRFCVVCGAKLSDAAPDTPAPARTTPTAGASWAGQAWVAAPPLEEDGGATSSPHVEFRISGEPPRQSRWSVLFRIVLAAPLLVWLALVLAAAEIVTVVSWFAALFSARVPRGPQRFVTNVVRYQMEVGAYVLTLVARWPGFRLAAGDHAQVELGIAQYRLNRAAVFFRVVLMIPGVIVSFFVTYAIYLLAVATWISTLVLGRPARPLYGASSLALRYIARQYSFVFLLTPTQPFAGFFGDPAVGVSGATVPTTITSTGLRNRLVLSTSARVIFIASLVLGGVLGAVYQTKVVNVKGLVARVIVVPVVTGANKNILNDLATFSSSADTCASGRPATCISVAAGNAQNAVAQQIVTLNGIAGLVSRGRVPYDVYVAGARRIDADLTTLSLEVNANQERSLIVAHLAPDVAALGVEYERLRAAL